MKLKTFNTFVNEFYKPTYNSAAAKSVENVNEKLAIEDNDNDQLKIDTIYYIDYLRFEEENPVKPEIDKDSFDKFKADLKYSVIYKLKGQKGIDDWNKSIVSLSNETLAGLDQDLRNDPENTHLIKTLEMIVNNKISPIEYMLRDLEIDSTLFNDAIEQNTTILELLEVPKYQRK